MKLRRYRTGLYESLPGNNPSPPFRARGWRAEYQNMVTKNNGRTEQPDPHQRHHMTLVLESHRNDDGTLTMTYAPEIIVLAKDRIAAQQAVNLIGAACTVSRTTQSFFDDLAALPEDESDLEDLREEDYSHLIGKQYSTNGIATSVAIAAKATLKKRWTYALSKLWLSFKICSVDWIDLHPQYGQQFRVENNPINHVYFAYAIIGAYSAIEELNLHVIASSKQPARVNRQWNPPVLANLQSRLVEAGVDLSEKFLWHLRNTPSRIELQEAPPAGNRASWARYSIRDRLVGIEDAIQYAWVLRSRVSAHQFSRNTRSLTIYDVTNVQMLARRLILENLGFWRSM